jgi:NAD(P)-dependent dehydrogenase (short-subunit alcohol dehydrogenase family)
MRLAMEGARVVVSARTTEEGESRMAGALTTTVEHIRKAGGEAVLVKADLTQAADRERLVAEATEALGPIDILVNNAAITYFLPIADFTEKRFKLMMEVQVYAPFHLAQLALPSMQARGQGWIVNISSGAARHPKQPYGRGGRGQTVYGMCKAALERFSTGLAFDVHRDGIAVNVVSPGLVETPGLLANVSLSEADRARVQPISYIAEAVYQLASCDPKTMTGRIDNAEPLLRELGVIPAELV